MTGQLSIITEELNEVLELKVFHDRKEYVCCNESFQHLLLERFVREGVTRLILFHPLDYVLEAEKYKLHAEKRTFSRTSLSDG